MNFSKTSHHENGNALWFVLIAVALLAAVYDKIARPVVTDVLRGYNGTIFACKYFLFLYGTITLLDGQTGTGFNIHDICFLIISI
jgi:hypothetical protein